MPARELIDGYVMLLLLGFSCTFLPGSHSHRRHGLLEIRWALLSSLIALAFFSLRGSVPLALVVVCGQTAGLITLAFLYLALARAVGRPSRLFPFLAVLLPVFVAGLCYFSIAQNNLEARIVIVSLAGAIILAWTLPLTMRREQPTLRAPQRAVFWLLIAMIALRLARVVVAIVFQPHPNVLLVDPFQSFVTFWMVIGGLAQIGGTFWISVSRQREKDRSRADTDGLTGLLNRRAFEAIIQQDLAIAGRETTEVSLLLVDLDFFKSMNDEFGHLAGDSVLRRVAGVLRRSVRPTDTVARFGGDEFAVMLSSTSPRQALAVAERIRHGLVEMRHLPGGRKMTASLGIATAEPGDTLTLLFERADKALYRSKQMGRNRLSVFEDESDQVVIESGAGSALLQ